MEGWGRGGRVEEGVWGGRVVQGGGGEEGRGGEGKRGRGARGKNAPSSR